MILEDGWGVGQARQKCSILLRRHWFAVARAIFRRSGAYWNEIVSVMDPFAATELHARSFQEDHSYYPCSQRNPSMDEETQAW